MAKSVRPKFGMGSKPPMGSKPKMAPKLTGVKKSGSAAHADGIAKKGRTKGRFI